jgi:hypothetical protein
MAKVAQVGDASSSGLHFNADAGIHMKFNMLMRIFPLILDKLINAFILVSEIQSAIVDSLLATS